MKKLFIIGAGIEQLPAIKMAKDMGYYVLTSDYNPNAPGMEWADKSFTISTNDAQSNLKVAQEENIDGVMTICSETAVPVVGYICEQLNLIGMTIDTAIKSTHKGAMRKAMEAFGVDMPERRHVSKLQEAIDFCDQYSGPWVLKPSDSSGQRGTNLIHSKEELHFAFSEAAQFSSDNKVLIDQFIEGQEINVNAIVKDGNVEILSLADRNTLPSPHFGIAVLHIAPPNINSEEIEAVKKLAVKAIQAIGLENGIAYPQIIVTKDGPKLIEIAARMPGGYNREMAMNLSGIDMIKAQILISLGEQFSFNELKEHNIYTSSGVKLLTSVDYPDLTGKKIIALEGVEEVMKNPNIQSCNMHLKRGDTIPSLNSSVGRFVAIIGVGDSKKEVEQLLENSKNKLKIIVE